jgi:hypothetical protein
VHDLCDELGLRCQVDITAGAARAWTNVDTALRADLPKVGHHGSKNSTMRRPLIAVHPRSEGLAREKAIPIGIPTWSYLSGLKLLAFGSCVQTRLRSPHPEGRKPAGSQVLRGVSGCIRKCGPSTGANRHIKRSNTSKSKKPIAA